MKRERKNTTTPADEGITAARREAAQDASGEAISKAMLTAGTLTDWLRAALHGAGEVEGIVLMPLIGKAAELKQALTELADARAMDRPRLEKE